MKRLLSLMVVIGIAACAPRVLSQTTYTATIQVGEVSTEFDCTPLDSLYVPLDSLFVEVIDTEDPEDVFLEVYADTITTPGSRDIALPWPLSGGELFYQIWVADIQGNRSCVSTWSQSVPGRVIMPPPAAFISAQF